MFFFLKLKIGLVNIVCKHLLNFLADKEETGYGNSQIGFENNFHALSFKGIVSSYSNITLFNQKYHLSKVQRVVAKR